MRQIMCNKPKHQLHRMSNIIQSAVNMSCLFSLYIVLSSVQQHSIKNPRKHYSVFSNMWITHISGPPTRYTILVSSILFIEMLALHRMTSTHLFELLWTASLDLMHDFCIRVLFCFFTSSSGGTYLHIEPCPRADWQQKPKTVRPCDAFELHSVSLKRIPWAMSHSLMLNSILD